MRFRPTFVAHPTFHRRIASPSYLRKKNTTHSNEGVKTSVKAPISINNSEMLSLSHFLWGNLIECENRPNQQYSNSYLCDQHCQVKGLYTRKMKQDVFCCFCFCSMMWWINLYLFQCNFILTCSRMTLMIVSYNW